MSDEDNDSKPPESDDEVFDLDWDDALAELEDELDDAEKDDAHLSEARPLYRPPSPDDPLARRPPPPTPVNLDDHPAFGTDEDDEGFASTKIAEIPQELINSLVDDPGAHKRPTKPPPPADRRPGAEQAEDSPSSVDLDLDGLLDGLDEETVVYAQPRPSRPPSGEKLVTSDEEARFFGARPPVGTGPIGRSHPPGPSEEDSFDPFAEDDDLITSSPMPAVEPEAKTRVASAPSSDALDLGGDFGDEEEARTRVVSSAYADSVAESRGEEEDLPPTKMRHSPFADGEAGAALPGFDEVDDDETRVAPPPSEALAEPREDDFEDAQTRIVTAPSELEEADASPGAADSATEASAPAVEPTSPELAPKQPVTAQPAKARPAKAQPAKAQPAPPTPKPASRQIAAKPPATPGPDEDAAAAKATPGAGPTSPSVAKPGLPSIPKPPGFGKKFPKPGAAPTGVRPKLPPIPKPGARPSVPKPNIPIPRPSKPGTAAKPRGKLSKKTLVGRPSSAPARPVTPPKPPGAAPPAAAPPAAAPPAAAPPAAEGPSAAGPSPAQPPAPKPPGAKPAPPPQPPSQAKPPSPPPLPTPGAAAEPPAPEPPPGGEAKPEIESDLDALLSADRRRASEAPPAATPPPKSAPEPAEADTVADADSAEITVADDSADISVGDDSVDISIDDDSAEISVGDDSADISVGDDDGSDMAVVSSDDDEWDDEDWAALEAAEAEADAAAEPPPSAAPDDRGAVAARRTVRSRKPRDEHFPMVGDEPSALRLRVRLLKSLGENRQGAVRARLLVGAAEIAEQLGDVEDARELYVQALSSDPTDVVALRALRRDAVARGEWKKVATLYEREAKLDLGDWGRAMAWTALAELNLGPLDDPDAAERAALAALEAQPVSMAATLLLAEARWRKDRHEAAVEAFGAAREIWDDPDARAALAVEEARVAEAKGDEDQARELYTWANDVDPEALDAWFGRARTSSRAEADPQGAVEALATLAAYCGGPLGEAILTRASRVATRIKKDPPLGVRLLGEATGVLPLQARADAALATGDTELELACLAAWAGAAGGTDRALALVRAAEAKAAQGDLDGAESALRDAALADGSLGTIRVVREVIARRSGDMSRLADVMDSGGALAGAARVARDRSAVEREHELLLEAVAEGTALVSADVLGLDVAAARADAAGIEEALRRQADRVPPEQRVGSLLALTDRAIEREDLDAAEALLQEAHKLAPGDPLTSRPLGRLALRSAPERAANLWMEEAESTTGTRAAFAATQAGHLLAASGGDAMGPYRKALHATPGYGPAAWALKPVAMEMGDPLTLGEVYAQLAATAADPQDAAGNLVRGALLRADADPAGAGELLVRANEHVPRDMVMTSLQMRLAGEGDSLGRAKILASAAARAAAPLDRVYRIQAAQAFEDGGDHAAAAEQLVKVAEADPHDPLIEEALDRVQIGANQVARVAERRMRAVKEASSDDERTLALERLADLDMRHRNDPASAVLSLQAILETAPGHLPSLRTLYRYYASQGRKDDAAQAVAAHAEHVQAGPDVTAYARLARRLMLSGVEATPEPSDALLLKIADRADMDLWLAPRVLAAALEAPDLPTARKAARALASLLGAPEERASSRLRAAELVAPEDAAAARELLQEAVQASPDHPLAAAALAEACEAAGDLPSAAEAFETAGAAAAVPSRGAAMYYRAARIWQDEADDEARAREALTRASERDVTHADVFDRLRSILEAADDKAALADLYQHRLAAGADDPELVELYVKQADLRRQISDLNGAKAALRSALTLQPERVDALRSLANLCLEDEDWRGAAEVLIRIARIRKEREELRWVFFTLGNIYDQHMPDPRRAEAAFRRVLKLFPNDLPAMERLAGLYRRQGQLPKAAQVLEDLAEREVDLEASRDHRLQLAEIHEQLGDARKAEAVLEEARKHAPTDLTVVRRLAEFYQRQNAANAMSMHLRRAVNDFRHALEADLSDAAAWPGLIEVLQWNKRPDAAAAAASAAQAIGITDIEMSKLVDARGAAPGFAGGAAQESLDELLAPAALGAPARAVFKLAGDALEKSLPFDVNAYRAERVDTRDTRIRPLALEVARWFGLSPVELYVTSAAPRVCVPVQTNPCTILIGAELLGITDDREKLFVLARAFKIAQANLSVVVRSQPQEVVALLGGLVQSYDPHHVPTGVDPAHVAEAARRVAKNIGRRAADELGPLIFEMAGRPGYDPAQLAMAASAWGNRTALVASGSAPAAISALAKLSGERDLPPDPRARVALLSRFAEASSLLAFALTDAHFEARERAGTG